MGVLVTTKRPLPVQRFTGAHELGHAALGHEISFDDEEILERPIFASDTSGDPREDQANAFAAQLLTPEWLIVHHMKRQGWRRDSLNDPATVYQLALRMGSSYSATCYALAQCDGIDRSTRDRLLEVKPKAIKQSLVKPYEPESGYGDVWLVTEHDNGMVLEGSRTDLVVLKFLEHSVSGYVWQFGDLVDAGMSIVEDGRACGASDQHSGRAFEEVWKAVEADRPVLVGMTISAAFFMPRAGGVIDSDELEDAALRHAVVVVATGTKANKRLLLARNSGGGTWGLLGYAWLGERYVGLRIKFALTLK